jgi:hypothetical protein
MSERRYNTIERYRVDTWAFVAFFAIMAMITHI